MSRLVALGLDPGFSSFGWAAVDIAIPGAESLLALGVIRTKKDKGKVLCRDDDHRRSAEIVRALLAVTHAHRPAIICAEALSLGGGGAAQRMQISTMAKMGRVWGIVDTLCEIYDAPLIQVSPQALKKAATGRVGATKLEVQAELDEFFNGELGALLATIRARGQHEHPVDAAGAVVASLNHDHLRLARAAFARARTDTHTHTDEMETA